MPAVEFSVHQERVQEVARALRDEADGKKLRRELAANMREALKPAVTAAKAGIMGMASSGTNSAQPLRATIASRIRAEARLTGRSTGARVKARQTPNLRGFAHAPKRTQRRRGWRHPVYGSDTWVPQTGRIEWFDDATRSGRSGYRAAVLKAVENMAKRIKSRS